MSNIDTLPIEIGEKMFKGLPCSTLYDLSPQIPSATYHYNIKCRPSNFRKDLNNYYMGEYPSYIHLVFEKLMACFDNSKMDFIKNILAFIKNNYLSERNNWSISNNIKDWLWVMTSETADELAMGRINMRTIEILDFVSYKLQKYYDSRILPIIGLDRSVLQISSHILMDRINRIKYVKLRNINRYYFARIVALASKDEPSILRFLQYPYSQSSTWNDLELQKKTRDFIISPRENSVTLNRRFAEWVNESVAVFESESESIDENSYGYYLEAADSEEDEFIQTRSRYILKENIIYVYIAEKQDNLGNDYLIRPKKLNKPNYKLEASLS